MEPSHRCEAHRPPPAWPGAEKTPRCFTRRDGRGPRDSHLALQVLKPGREGFTLLKRKEASRDTSVTHRDSRPPPPTPRGSGPFARTWRGRGLVRVCQLHFLFLRFHGQGCCWARGMGRRAGSHMPHPWPGLSRPVHSRPTRLISLCRGRPGRAGRKTQLPLSGCAPSG